MFRFQREKDYALYDIDNYYLNQQDFSNIKSNCLTVSLENNAYASIKDGNIYIDNKKIANKSEIRTKLKGEHNLKNIMFALVVAYIYKLDLSKAIESIEKFEPLKHRMELNI